MLRPRESRDLSLIANRILISPTANLTWTQDVFGNAVATAVFGASSDMLVIESTTELQHNAVAWPIFDIAASAVSYPFQYSEADWTDLGALAIPQHVDHGGRLDAWARAFVRGALTDTLSLLKDLSLGVASWVLYQSREEEGTQTPIETLNRGWGSCRDFAVLFVEAARRLGFGARIVSGYLLASDERALGSANAGSTHAWGEVYVPGAGWIAFDPTNRSVGGFGLIPVSVARDIAQTTPISGSFVGPYLFEGMTVEVSVIARKDHESWQG